MILIGDRSKDYWLETPRAGATKLDRAAVRQMKPGRKLDALVRRAVRGYFRDTFPAGFRPSTNPAHALWLFEQFTHQFDGCQLHAAGTGWLVDFSVDGSPETEVDDPDFCRAISIACVIECITPEGWLDCDLREVRNPDMPAQR